MPEEQTHVIESHEISFKELISKLGSYFQELRNNWKLIALVSLVFVLFFMYKAITDKATYPAQLTFMVNEDEGNSNLGISNILGQFGFGGTSNEYNIDKILELLKSRRITQQVLFKQVTLDEKTDYLANHLINQLTSKKEWAHVKWYRKPFVDMEELTSIKNFRFTNDSMSYNNPLENAVLKEVYKSIVGDPENRKKALLQSDYSEMSGIMSITVAAYHEGLSIALSNTFYEVLRDYYVEKSIEKQKTTYDIVKSKYDSLAQELRAAEYNLAALEDQNRGVFTRKGKLDETRLKNRVIMLSAGLAKAMENLEIAEFALQSKTPFIQEIDRPIAPIRPVKKSKLTSLILGLLMGVFLSSAFLIIRKITKESLQ